MRSYTTSETYILNLNKGKHHDVTGFGNIQNLRLRSTSRGRLILAMFLHSSKGICWFHGKVVPWIKVFGLTKDLGVTLNFGQVR